MFRERTATIIFEGAMKFIDLIGNKFLSSIYQDEDFEMATLGFFSMNYADEVELHLHVFKKPRKSVEKWGVWGRDFNVVVIKILLQGIKKVEMIDVHHLSGLKLFDLDWVAGGTNMRFCCDSKSQSIGLLFNACTFQNCVTYII